jgi:hypothetical protein
MNNLGLFSHGFAHYVDHLEVNAELPNSKATFAHQVVNPSNYLKCGAKIPILKIRKQHKNNFTAPQNATKIVLPICLKWRSDVNHKKRGLEQVSIQRKIAKKLSNESCAHNEFCPQVS